MTNAFRCHLPIRIRYDGTLVSGDDPMDDGLMPSVIPERGRIGRWYTTE